MTVSLRSTSSLFQSQTVYTGHSDRGTSSIAWEAKENKGLRGSLFWRSFGPLLERHFRGISSSSRFWRRARVHAQHGRHCDPRSIVQLRPRTSVLRLGLTHPPFPPSPGTSRTVDRTAHAPASPPGVLPARLILSPDLTLVVRVTVHAQLNVFRRGKDPSHARQLTSCPH